MKLEDIIKLQKVVPTAQLAADPELLSQTQTELAKLRLYPSNEIDGIWGPNTESGLSKFCESVYLDCPSTGLWGPTFAKALLEAKTLDSKRITPQNVLKIAASSIGYKESPAGSNRSKFGKWYGMDAQPWCAMFVSYCFHAAGLPLAITTPKGFAYCPYGVQWFRQQGKFFKTPKVGDVVFFDWGRDGIADHVGIVEALNPDGTITTIEGNTSQANDSNGGAVMRRVRSLKVVQGFGRPAYYSM